MCYTFLKRIELSVIDEYVRKIENKLISQLQIKKCLLTFSARNISQRIIHWAGSLKRSTASATESVIQN